MQIIYQMICLLIPNGMIFIHINQLHWVARIEEREDNRQVQLSLKHILEQVNLHFSTVDKLIAYCIVDL
jgi:RNA polymerase sigma-54 factor